MLLYYFWWRRQHQNISMLVDMIRINWWHCLPLGPHHWRKLELKSFFGSIKADWMWFYLISQLMCTSFPAGVCHTSATYGDTHDDAQLLVHHTEPASLGHAAIPRLHPPVFTFSCPRPPTWKPHVTSWPSWPSQQSPRPLIGHAVILHLIPRTDATAAAKVSTKWQSFSLSYLC